VSPILLGAISSREGKVIKKPLVTIGRKRLPPGIVAVLDDPEGLRAAIRELHSYAKQNRGPGRPRRGIVFRVVEEWEYHAIRHKLADLFGPKYVSVNESLYSVPVGFLHFLDDSFVSHACNRHAVAEGARHHLVLTPGDFERIPDVVNPRHIREFSMSKGMPRIVYEREYDGMSLVVVEEVQSKAGLTVKTAYRKK